MCPSIKQRCLKPFCLPLTILIQIPRDFHARCCDEINLHYMFRGMSIGASFNALLARQLRLLLVCLSRYCASSTKNPYSCCLSGHQILPLVCVPSVGILFRPSIAIHRVLKNLLDWLLDQTVMHISAMFLYRSVRCRKLVNLVEKEGPVLY